MEKISIISLIYQSVEFAESLYTNLIKYTPELKTGEAEFYFIANDATNEVVDFLEKNNYPHFINNNKHYTENELFNMGYAFPEYINRVYAGYNYGIRISKNPIVVLINSDTFFSPDWLRNLKKRLTMNTAVSSKILQPNWFLNKLNKSRCLTFNFGKSIKKYDEIGFLKKVEELKEDSVSIGNAFMPLMIYKQNIEKVGYYPEGNIHDGTYKKIKLTGDEYFFTELEKIGIKHITSNDSIVYHLDSGERKMLLD